MASSGSLSVHKMGSEEKIDYKCSTCCKKKKERKSEKFCVECQKHFCSTCLEAHNVIHDDHSLQEPSQATGQELPSERCPQHPAKVVDMYCQDHDEVECSACAFDKHKSCKTVLYIPNEVGQLFHKKDLKKARAELDRVKDRLTDGEKIRDRQAGALQTEREKQLSAVDSYVETLVAIIRNLEKAEKKMLVNKFKEEADKLQQNTDNCQEVMTDIQKCHSQLDSHDKNTAQLFVSIKKSQKIITDADQLVQEIHEVTKCQFPQFKYDRQIEQYLAGLQTLAVVVDKPFLLERQQNPVERKQNIKHQLVVTPTLPQTLYKIRQTQNIHIRIKEDGYKCNIWGTCLLPDGSLLMSDNNNKKLKRLDTTTYTITDYCNLPDQPHGVCCISQQEAAVCLYNNTIQFVHVSLGPHKMALTRSIQLTCNGYGISYWGNNLCVSNWGNDVLFYTLSGTLIRSGNLGLSETHNITFSQSGNALYIADKNLGLIGVDMKGREIFRYKGLGLEGCESVCVDGCGSVFVGGRLSRNVLQVAETGQPLGEVVPCSADALKTGALSFDCSNKRLFVAGLSDTMTVNEML